MEMKQAIYRRPVRFLGTAFLVLLCSLHSQAQQPKYTVRNGRMYIEIARDTRAPVLDSFIQQFNLHDLYIKDFLYNKNPDSLLRQGWSIDVNNARSVVVSKAFEALVTRNDGRVELNEPSFAALFPSESVFVPYGYNSFRDKRPFQINDSVVHFLFRGANGASKVQLAASFTDWQFHALDMRRTDSGWVLPVKLGPGKYWYKFIIDGNWTTDPNNQNQEGDGQGNTNSVFYVPNTLFTLEGFTHAKKVFLAGSFNNWEDDELAMQRTGTGWQLPLYLAQGTHTYKFVIDNDWHTDEANPDRLPDGNGGSNSVIRIGRTRLFVLKGHADARQVVLSGSFNKWRENELLMKKTATGWEIPYTLGPGNYSYKVMVDGHVVADTTDAFTNEQGISYLVIDPNYTFHLKGFGNAQHVFLSGDFNDWSHDAFPMKKTGDGWTIQMHLSIGKHLYKLIVDGKWMIDPDNKLWEQNEYGNGNSVLWKE